MTPALGRSIVGSENSPRGANTPSGTLKLVGPLAVCNLSGTSNTSGTAYARIVNPSARLRCTFSVSFQPAIAGAITDYGVSGSTWDVRAMSPGSNGGPDSELHLLQSSQSLPRSYELDSGIKVVRVTAGLQIPRRSAVEIAGNWVIEVEWEPSVPMCADELQALFGRCGLSTQPVVNPLVPSS